MNAVSGESFQVMVVTSMSPCVDGSGKVGHAVLSTLVNCKDMLVDFGNGIRYDILEIWDFISDIWNIIIHINANKWADNKLCIGAATVHALVYFINYRCDMCGKGRLVTV